MKKILFLVSFLATVATTYGQRGDLSVIANIGYQTEYERFAIAGQARYNLTERFRLAPDVTFFFPKHKVTGLDINLNLHYVFDLSADQLSFYPLAGFGMENNFLGKQTIGGVEIDSQSRSKLAFNVGAGLTYNLSASSFLNIEGKFVFGDDDCAVFLLGYGWRF